MDRLEQYCIDNGWIIDNIPGYLRVIKGEKIIHRKFEIAMDIDDIIFNMYAYDSFTALPEEQMEFEFMI